MQATNIEKKLLKVAKTDLQTISSNSDNLLHYMNTSKAGFQKLLSLTTLSAKTKQMRYDMVMSISQLNSTFLPASRQACCLSFATLEKHQVQNFVHSSFAK